MKMPPEQEWPGNWRTGLGLPGIYNHMQSHAQI